MSDMWFSFRQQQLGETDWHKPEDNMTKLDEVLKRFDSGATRSEIGERFSLLPWDSLMAAARVMAQGEKVHGSNNWRKGFPIAAGIDHVIRHLALYMEGDTEEDHLSHAVAGLLMCKHFDLKGEKFNEDT